MADRPLRVSVIMAVYNGEPFVAEGIGSLLAQTFDDFELIVVNDGSTDRTAEIVAGFDDPRIRLVANERNLGLAPSLNRGLALARGEFIARQDADDRSVPDRLARQVAFMDANPDVALLGSWFTEIAADGTRRESHPLPTSHADLSWYLWMRCPFVHSAVLWRRALVAEDVGGYDERLAYSMDYDLWRRIAARHRVANLPESLVELRTHGASMTATYNDRAREGYRMRVANAARALGWPDDDPRTNEARFARLHAVLFESVSGRPADELLAAATEVVRLHEAFVAAGGVGAEDVRRQRRWVRDRLGHKLLRAARAASFQRRYGESWRLLGAAARLAPGRLLTRDAAETLRSLGGGAYRVVVPSGGPR
jgi:hypothetical protein